MEQGSTTATPVGIPLTVYGTVKHRDYCEEQAALVSKSLDDACARVETARRELASSLANLRHVQTQALDLWPKLDEARTIALDVLSASARADREAKTARAAKALGGAS